MAKLPTRPLTNLSTQLRAFAIAISRLSRRRPTAAAPRQSFLLQKSFALITHSAQPESKIGPRTAYVMSPTNDDIVEFARISGIA